MKYKVGDRVRIKSLDWYNENKDEDGEVACGEIYFLENMKKFCSEILTIQKDVDDGYLMLEDNHGYVWTDEMIEGLVEEETKPLTYEETVEIIETMQGIGDSWECPQGYQFVDENGSVINATKIVLEKKKTEYPKTYEECAKVLLDRASVRNDFGYKGELLVALQKLLVCRDAYWKIYGEENGLGKPWEPDFNNISTNLEYIKIVKGCFTYSSRAFAFPTPEMRDAFYENFKEDIEICKEFL